MAAPEITEWFVDQFGRNVFQSVQQDGSKLRGTVREQDVTGDYFSADILEATTMALKTTRHAPTPLTDAEHEVRWGAMLDYDRAVPIDKEDKLKMLLDPMSDYVSTLRKAAGRQFDDTIIAAFFADAVTAKDKGSTVSYDANMTIANASLGMTLAKVRAAKYELDSRDVPAEGRFIAHHAEQLYDLLGDTTLTSIDYNTVKALINGEVDTFLGFKFIMTTRCTVTTLVRHCPYWHRDGLSLGVGQNPESKVDQRTDLSYLWQAYISMSVGAVRLQEEMVGKIDCLEAL